MIIYVNPSILKKCVALSLLSTLVSAPAFADNVAIPDAGSVAAGVNQDREWKPKADEADVKVDLGQPTGEGAEIKLHVNQIRFIGATNIPEADLQALVAPDIKEDISVADLWKIAGKVTEYLHKQGYMASLAVLPEQEIKDNIVTIQVLLGYYDKVGFENESKMTTGRAVGLTHAARPDKLIERKPLDRALLILNDIPGVKGHAFLAPGGRQGTSNIIFRLTTTETDGGVAYIDNYGSRFTGRWRIGGSYHWNNISHVGDQIQIGYLQSFGRGIQNYDFRYELPVGNDGTFAGIEFFRTDYTLGEQYAKYDAYGVSHGWKLYSRTPLKRTLNNNLYFHFAISHTTLTDRMTVQKQDSEKHGDALRLRQCLLNLAGNALKFTEQGCVKVGCRRLSNQNFYFYVADTGCGIEEESRRAIFERFVKMNYNIRGTGLGLSICKSIIEHYGGGIGVESKKGEGSTFYFTLPAKLEYMEYGKF